MKSTIQIKVGIQKLPKLCFFLLLSVFACAFTSAAPIFWNGNGSNDLFTNPENWQPNQVPGPNDEAIMHAAGSIVLPANTTVQVQRFELGDPMLDELVILSLEPGSRLVVTQGTSVQTASTRILFGGGEITVNAPAVATLSGQISWTDVRFGGDGTVNFNPGLGFTADQTDSITLDTVTLILGSNLNALNGLQLTLNNAATFLVGNGPELVLGNGSTVTSTTGTPGTLTIADGSRLLIGGEPPRGVAKMDASKMPPGQVTISVPLINQASVNMANNFELVLSGGGTHSGEFITESELDVLVIAGGEHTLRGAVLGNTRVTGGDLNLADDLRLQNGIFALEGGVINGNGHNLGIETEFEWRRGVMRGPLLSECRVDCDLSMSTAEPKELNNGAVLTNNGGQATVFENTVLGIEENAQIQHNSGQLQVYTGARLVADAGRPGGVGTVNFDSTIQVINNPLNPAPIGTVTEITCALNINDTLGVVDGTLRWSGPGTINGTVSITAGQALVLAGANKSADGALIGGAGAVRLEGGLFSVEAGTVEIAADTELTLDGATITGTGTFNHAGDFVWLSGGFDGFDNEAGGNARLSGSVASLRGEGPKFVRGNYFVRMQAATTFEAGELALVRGSLTGAMLQIDQPFTVTNADAIRAEGTGVLLSLSAGLILDGEGIFVNEAGAAAIGGIRVLNGTLSQVGSLQTEGANVVAEGAVLAFTGGNSLLAPGVEIAGDLIVDNSELFIQQTGVDSTGRLTIRNNGRVQINQPSSLPMIDLSMGTLDAGPGLTVTNQMTWSGGSLTTEGPLQIGPNAALNLTGATEPLSLAGTVTILNDGSFNLNDVGTLNLETGAEIRVDTGAEMNLSQYQVTANDIRLGQLLLDGVLNKSGVGEARLDLSINLAGALNVGGGRINVPRDLNVATNSSISLAGGTLAVGTDLILAQGSVLHGPGSVQGNLVNHGTIQLASGFAAGQVNLSGNFNQSDTGNLIVNLQAGDGGALVDLLAINGQAGFGGNLSVNFVAGFEPPVDAPLTVVTYNTRGSGDFATETIPTPLGATMTVTDLEGVVTLTSSGPAAVTWAADADGDWHDPDNWQPNLVPGRNTNVTINNAATVSVNQPVTVAALNLGGTGAATLVVQNASVRCNRLEVAANATLRLIDGLVGAPGGGTDGPDPEKRGIPLSNRGTIEAFGESVVDFFAENDLGGTIRVIGDTGVSPNRARFTFARDFTNLGLISLTSRTATESGFAMLPGSPFNNDGDFIVETGAGGARVLDGGIQNRGRLIVNADFTTERGNGVAIRNDGVFEINNAAVTILFGVVQNNATMEASGSLAVQDDAAALTNTGVLFPGGQDTAGQFAINGNFTNDGTVELDLDGGDGGESDQIQVSGTATLNVGLTIDSLVGVESGSRFTLLTSNQLFGDNFIAQVRNLPNGLVYEDEVNEGELAVVFGELPPNTEPQVYVVDTGIPGVVALDAADGAVITTIQDNVPVSDVATGAGGEFLYAVSPINGVTSQFATETNTRSSLISAFPEAYAVAVRPDDREVWFLLNSGGGGESKRGLSELGVFTLATEQARFLSVPCAATAQALLFHPEQRIVYTLGADGSVCAIDADNHALIQSATFMAGFIDGVIDENGDFLYAFDVVAAQVWRINLDDLSATTLSVPAVAERGALYNNRLFMTTTAANIQVLDLTDESTTVVAVADAGRIRDISIFAAGPTAYVADQDNGVFTFNPAGESWTPVALDGPFVRPIRLVDNEIRPLGQASIAFSDTAYSVNEGAGSLTVPVTRSGVAWETVIVTLTGADGTALDGEDFIAEASQVFFGLGNETINMSIPILDDEAVEGLETFTLSLSGATNNGVITRAVATVTIVDNDAPPPAPLLHLSSAAYRVTEGDESVVVRVQRDAEATADEVSVTLVTSEGSALAGSDFQALEQTVILAPGIASVEVAIPIRDDADVEEMEQFHITLQDPVNAELGTPDNAVILIADNDFLTVAWTQAEQTIKEQLGGTMVTIRAALSAPNPGLLTVPFSIGGSATAGVDHTLTNGVLTFATGATQAELSFTVLDDSLTEDTETIRLQLLSATVVPVLPATQLITILDNDTGGDDGGDGGDGGEAPDTTITSPQNESEFKVGQRIDFKATGTDPEDDTLQYFWEICASSGDCQTLRGESVGASFTQPGLYVAASYTVDSNGNRDLSPARIRFRVREALPPKISIIEPSAKLLNLTSGAIAGFITETNAEAVQVRWYFISDPTTDVGAGPELSLPFPNEGRYTLVAEAIGSDGQTATDYINVLVSLENLRPVQLTVNRPEPASVFNVGEVIQFEAEVSNPDQRKKALSFFWDFGDGTQLEGISVTNRFSQAGRYTATIVARDEVEDVLLQDSVTIYVYGDMPPLVDINIPSDVQIEPFGSGKRVPEAGVLFFEARVRDPRGFRVQDLDFFWDFGDGRTSNQATPGRTVFQSEGVYTVSLFARTRNGLVSPVVRRTVTVMEVDENTYEPNETFSQAKPLAPGSYNRQTLPEVNSVDVYRLNVEQTGQRLAVKINIDGTVRAELYDGLQQRLISRIIENQGTVQLNGLSAGDYYLRVSPIAGKSKRMLSYGFTVSVLNPGLYLADIQSNEMFQTEIGIVNTTNSEISVEAIAYDAQGGILARAPFTLPGNGRAHQEISQLFDGEQRDIAWVQVDATGVVAGYARTCARDGKEDYLISAGDKLSSDLFVPHIAEKVDHWYTRASVVNAADGRAAAVIQTQSLDEAADAALTLEDKFSQDQFDFVDRFGGALPNERIWAKLSEVNANSVLVGSEVFGTVDGSRVAAGLALVDTGRDNPNFTFVPNTMFFTHIARDVAQFWTGISLVNIGTAPQSARIAAYGPAGNHVGDVERRLAPNEKVVVLARDLLGSIGSPADIDWLQVTADADVVGFELFGTHNQKQMAGLEATTGVKSNLCFPFFDSSNRSHQGISVVNVNPRGINVTFTLYDNQGVAIQTATRQLAARQKLVETISSLLPASERDDKKLPGWLEASADLPLAGFQLVIGKDGEQMSALKAQ